MVWYSWVTVLVEDKENLWGKLKEGNQFFSWKDIRDISAVR